MTRKPEHHIELPGCIVNIRQGLHDTEGRAVTAIEVLADSDRYVGDPQWWIETTDAEGQLAQFPAAYIRVVQRDKQSIEERHENQTDPGS